MTQAPFDPYYVTVESYQEPEGLIRQIPQTITTPDGYTAFIIPDGEFDNLLPPPVNQPMPGTGYMDLNGNVHYELCHTSWQFPHGFWPKFKIALNMRKFYMSVPGRFCSGCLSKDPSQLLGTGIYNYYPAEKLIELQFLGLKPRSEVPNVSPEVRKEAIFRFQRSYNIFAQWLGATRATTYTAIIPDKRMNDLSWRQFKIPTWQEKLAILKSCAPASLFGKLRAYEIIFPNHETGSGQ